jgi:hypothetical protein
MAALKKKGDLAELKVAADILARGYRIAFPYGEDCDYDLIADTGDALHRIQIKHAESNGEVIAVKCFSHSLTNGRIRKTKRYTSKSVEWLAVYDRTSDSCFYIEAAELGAGRSIIHLRLSEPRNGQRRRIRFAADYMGFPHASRARLDEKVEPAGLEPATSRMQTGRSSN